MTFLLKICLSLFQTCPFKLEISQLIRLNISVSRLKHTFYYRTGLCGAWTFNHNNSQCYLFSSNACCGQLEKREPDSDSISGYTCLKCWSTHNECPCGLKKREEDFTTTFIAGGGRVPNLGATVSFFPKMDFFLASLIRMKKI